MSNSLKAGRRVNVGFTSFEVKDGSLLWVLIPNEDVGCYRCVIKNTTDKSFAGKLRGNRNGSLNSR